MNGFHRDGAELLGGVEDRDWLNLASSASGGPGLGGGRHREDERDGEPDGELHAGEFRLPAECGHLRQRRRGIMSPCSGASRFPPPAGVE